MKHLTPQEKTRIDDERDNCPACNSNQYTVIYNGKPKRTRYFKKLQCDVCGCKYIAESNREFRRRIYDI